MSELRMCLKCNIGTLKATMGSNPRDWKNNFSLEHYLGGGGK